jgi:hypothetical protein
VFPHGGAGISLAVMYFHVHSLLLFSFLIFIHFSVLFLALRADRRAETALQSTWRPSPIGYFQTP